ncbi:OLC1v1020353C1 [Oldenlandia corymbosa var. corymbosa]|uniref:OLC1v1020353C1 n=1 Tax=Oldenlandia corymbosa var. corymbosa TaxID=529605 RepID=A0AAV1EGE5_OLDCO|nr:OLC1v1020353C1 [Oldenlandia corymbosa var. corymbosa]
MNLIHGIVIPEFKVHMASLFPLELTTISCCSPLNLTEGYNISAGWNVNFAIKNPSKEIIFSYSDMVAKLQYYDIDCISFWPTEIPAFEQAAEDGTKFLHLLSDRIPYVIFNDFHARLLAEDISRGRSYHQIRGECNTKVERKYRSKEEEEGGKYDAFAKCLVRLNC